MLCRQKIQHISEKISSSFFKKLYKKTSKYLDVFLRRFFMIHQDLLTSTFKAELYSFIEHFIFVFCLF